MPDNPVPHQPILAIIAGGEGRRMGGTTKCLLKLGNTTILERNIKRLSPQAGGIIINSNNHSEELCLLSEQWQARLISDSAKYSHCGPLAGLASALSTLATQQQAGAQMPTGLVTVPSDCPFLPEDLINRLGTIANKQPHKVVCASSLGQTHYMTAYWPLSVYPQLEAFLQRGERAVRFFLKQAEYETVDFAAQRVNGLEYDPFFNINTPEDYTLAQSIIDVSQ